MNTNTHQRAIPMSNDWPCVIGILCGVCIGFNACTKPQVVPPTPAPKKIEKTIPEPDPSLKVEAQMLETVQTAEGLGEGNPLLLSSLYNLAAFYEQQGDFEKAEAQYKRALAIKEKMSGPDHPDVAIILNKYADLLRAANRYDEAEKLSERAKAIMAKHAPSPTPQ